MTKGLVCAATWEELETFGLEPEKVLEEGRLWKIPQGFAAVTGVGIPFAMLRLPLWIESLKPDWVLNSGIAGAYPGSGLEIGDVVAGTTEAFADLGFEMPGEEVFRSLSDAPFAEALGKQPLPLHVPGWFHPGEGPPRLRLGKGATVNRCAGREGTGRLRRKMFGADFESMEGAAAALAGAARKLPVTEIRAISNFASDRDMRPENVRTALQSLREFWRAHRKFPA